jgi:hypothetical protein
LTSHFWSESTSLTRDLRGRRLREKSRSKLGIKLAGAHSPLARAHSGAFSKRTGEILLPEVAEFKGDLFDRKVAGEQQFLGPIHPELNQHGSRGNPKLFPESVTDRIVTGIRIEKHRSMRDRQKRVPMNLLPQLKTLRVQLFSAIHKIDLVML